MTELTDKAAIYLEENHISGDAMIYMDHQMDDLPIEYDGGAMYLADILARFADEVLQGTRHITRDAPATGQTCPSCDGLGQVDGTVYHTMCEHCQGTGQV